MATVTLGCKLPRGLMIGVGGQTAMLKGASASASDSDRGYGLTEVDKALADAWLRKFADFGPVKSGLIFVQPTDPVAQQSTGPAAQASARITPKAPRRGGRQ